MIKAADFQILKYIFFLFIGWKIVLSLIAYFGLSFLPVMLSPAEIGFVDSNTDFWMKWANWDGGHFRGIAENGYLHPFQVVFFPLYPLLIRALMFLNIPSLWGGIIISNVSIVLGLFYLYKLVSLDFDQAVAKKTVFLTLAFPTAFYFNAVYSESLFLFLTVAAFYFARTRKWFLAYFFASFSAVTRLIGVVVILAISVEYFLKTLHSPRLKEFWSEFLNRIAVYLMGVALVFGALQRFFTDNRMFLFSGLAKFMGFFIALFSSILFLVFIGKFVIKNFNFGKVFSLKTFYLILSLLPFLTYSLFLYSIQNNFFAFVSYEKHWERHLTLPWNAPINYFRDLAGIRFFGIGEPAQMLVEFLFFVFFFSLLIICYSRLRLSYTLFFALALFIPITSGTLQAIHRYELVVFPVFILLALLLKNETYYQVWMYFSLTLLGILTVLFINSYWVT